MHIVHIYHNDGSKRELRAATAPVDMIQYLVSVDIDCNTVKQFDHFPESEPYFWAYKWDGLNWRLDRRGIEQTFK